MPLIAILVGIAMLLFGRRLFWVFVAGIGFVSGALLAAEFLGEQEAWVVLVAAAVVGLVGTVLALLAQKIAIGIAGFLAGGYLGHIIAENMGGGEYAWLVFVVAGVVGAVLLIALFDWALILLSSLTGAAVVSQHVPWETPWPAVTFLVLLVVGLAVQIRQVLRPPAKPIEEKR
jgi:hypothetical protein